MCRLIVCLEVRLLWPYDNNDGSRFENNKFFSKFDSDGNQIGTGLGMYIVASSVNEYGGAYTITKITRGFGLDIIIPLSLSEDIL